MDHQSLWKTGLDEYDRGLFFEAHEHWEESWKELSGPAKLYLKALICLAGAEHLVSIGRFDPAERLFLRSLELWKECDWNAGEGLDPPRVEGGPEALLERADTFRQKPSSVVLLRAK
jgi:hypothetical protein